MGLFDGFKKAVNVVNKIVDPLDLAPRASDEAAGMWHKASGTSTAAERRQQKRDAAEQIQLYKDEAELTRQQVDEARAASTTEKRRVEEKQIRGLRNRSRGVGLLNSQNQDVSSSLGTSGGVPSKLGT